MDYNIKDSENAEKKTVLEEVYDEIQEADILANNMDVTAAEEKEMEMLGNIEIPETFTPCKNKEDISASDLCLSTSAVVERIGIAHRNVVLRYTNAFYDILTVRKDPINNRYLYTEESVKQLAFIMNDVKNSGRSFRQELEFLNSYDGKKVMSVASDNIGALEKMFNQMQDNIVKANALQLQGIKDELRQGLERNQMLLEDKSISELEERMEKQEELLRTIIEQKDEEIRSLKNQLEQKKKPFWPFGR